MILASPLRHARALTLAALLLVAPPALADTVTHQFTGQLTTITNGSGNSLDLTGLFSLGQAVTLDCTIERDTPGEAQDAYTTGYTGAITNLAFSIASWAGSGVPGYSLTTVSNDKPSPGLATPQGAAAVAYDQYSASVQGGLTAPPLGSTMFLSLTYTFDDVEGTVFGSTALPGAFPPMSDWEGKTVTFLFLDFTQGKSGYVMATLSAVTTPAQPATWGGVKALYR